MLLFSAPHTPVNWTKKRNKVLGNLSTFLSLLVKCLEVYLQVSEAPAEAAGSALVAALTVLFTNLALANTLKVALTSLVRPVSLLFRRAASETFSQQLLGKVSLSLSTDRPTPTFTEAFHCCPVSVLNHLQMISVAAGKALGRGSWLPAKLPGVGV